MIDHGQLTIRDLISYYLARWRARQVRRHICPEYLTFSVMCSADDGQAHLVSDLAALRVYREGFALGFPAVCADTMHPPETGWESGPAVTPRTGALCRRRARRLPLGAFIREPRCPVGELPAPRGERRD